MTLPDPIFDDGRITLYCGDSRELLPFVEERHGRIQHTFSDPPYSERTHKNARTLKGGDGPKELIDFGSTTFPLIQEILALANPARWTVTTQDHVHATMLELFPPEGMVHIRTGAWVKPDGTPQLTGDRPAQAHEAISILHSATEKMFWNSGGKRGIWEHGVERDIPWHTTPKPVPLCRELISDFCLKEDLIVDPFAGSGAFGVGARFEGIRAVLIEMDPQICTLTAQRLREGRARPKNMEMPRRRRKKAKHQLGFEF